MAFECGCSKKSLFILSLHSEVTSGISASSSAYSLVVFRPLPNIDTTGYATTFVNGETYEKEAQLFRLIVNDFLEGYDIENEDPAIWMDLSEGTVDILLFANRQTFSIVDEPLYVNYLSKITNFCDEEGAPTSTLNIFPTEVTRDDYFISGGSSTSVSSRLDLNTGVFEEVAE